jgi:hypothetical protein
VNVNEKYLQGVYTASVEADVDGAIKEYNWLIKDAPTNDASFDKDTFVIADLGRKMGR